MDEVYSWVRNIVVYLILNTIIMNLLGNKSYKKYVSIVSGMVLMLIVISPLMKLMKLDDNLDLNLQFNDLSIETSEFKNDLSRIEEDQRNAIFGEYEAKIRSETEQLLATEGITLKTFHITINQDVDSENFGEIAGMDITAVQQEPEGAQEKEQDRLKIDEIEISKITVGDESSEADKELPSPLEINIKNKLSDFYNVEQGNINISIQGG
jgi:stage III sporulation protein AF